MAHARKSPHGEPAAARAAARDTLARLRAGGDLIVATGSSRHILPDFVVRDVETLLEAYADGQTPSVSVLGDEVGTQQAADYLKLSRPTVVKMMDEGRIPFRKPGKHRRVRMGDLIAFERRLTHDRDAAMDALSALGQDAVRRAREAGRLSEEMI